MTTGLLAPLTEHAYLGRHGVLSALRRIHVELLNGNMYHAMDLLEGLQTCLAEDIAYTERAALVQELGWTPESVHQ